MKQSTTFAQVATNLLNVLQGYTKTIRLLLVMFLTLTVSAEVWGAEKTYTHIFTTKPDIGNNSLSNITWSVEATNLNGYNKGYAGVQFGTKNASGSITLTSANAWGEQSNTSYTGYTNVKYVYVWLNAGTGTPTATVTIGGKEASKSGTVSKNTAANDDYESTSKLTFTPISGGNTGVIKIAASTSSKAGYIAAIEVVCETPAASCTTPPTVSSASNSNITSTTATVSCSSGITSLGSAGCSITSYGFVYGTSSNPTISNTKVQVGTTYITTDDPFSKGLTGLTANTTYYVRPYATNGNGTAYGAQTSFKTLELPKYTVTWDVNGDKSVTTQVTEGSKPTFPATPSSCDATSTTFYGWATATWDGKIDDINGKTIYTSANNMPAVNGAVTYYAVFAEKSGFDGNIDFCNQGWTAGQDLNELGGNGILQCGDVTITFLLNSANTAPQYIKDGNTEEFAVRLYPKNQMTVSSSYDIKSITFTHASGEDNNTIICSSGSFSGTKWTGNTTSVTFTIGGDSGHRRITNINVEIADGDAVTYSNFTTSCTTTYTVDYVLDGGTGGCEDARVEEGGNHTICNDIPTRTGYTFQGWKYNNTETIYTEHRFTNIQADITLVAQWNPITYSVVFDKNEGSGTMNRQTFTYDVAQSLTANTFTRDKHEFAGWNTVANGSGTSYDDEDEVKNLTTENGATITLYAQWSELYTVTFYNMGSVYTTKTQESVGGSISFPEAPSACEGYTFDGWSATEVDGVPSYETVTTITPNEDTPLYAVYSKTEDGGGIPEESVATISYTDSELTFSGTGWSTNTQKGYSGNYLRLDNASQYVYFVATNGTVSQIKFTYKLQPSTSCSGHNRTNWWIGEIEFYASTDNGNSWSKIDSKSISVDSGDNLSKDIPVTYSDLSSGGYNAIKIQFAKDCGNLAIKGLSTISGGGPSTTYTTNPSCVPTYTITWKNEDGTVLETDKVEENATPTYDGAIPTKAADTQYTYTFNGWSPTIVAAIKDATYTATYTATVNKYTITWKNEDGTVLETDSEVEYGTMPTYDGSTPTKAANAQYTYTFDAWTPAISTVKDNATYTATFTETINQYQVTFNMNDHGDEITAQTVDYGSTAAEPNPTPTADGYKFAGWYKDEQCTIPWNFETDVITGNTAIHAKWLQIFTITWKANGLEYTTTNVTEGKQITPPAEPNPEDYCGDKFVGWTTAEMEETSNGAPTLYPTSTPFPTATKETPTTFYAVFADYVNE